MPHAAVGRKSSLRSRCSTYDIYSYMLPSTRTYKMMSNISRTEPASRAACNFAKVLLPAVVLLQSPVRGLCCSWFTLRVIICWPTAVHTAVLLLSVLLSVQQLYCCTAVALSTTEHRYRITPRAPLPCQLICRVQQYPVTWLRLVLSIASDIVYCRMIHKKYVMHKADSAKPSHHLFLPVLPTASCIQKCSCCHIYCCAKRMAAVSVSHLTLHTFHTSRLSVAV